MKRGENKKNPSSVLGSGAEEGFDSEGAGALYDELTANELGQEPYAPQEALQGLGFEDEGTSQQGNLFHLLPFPLGGGPVVKKIRSKLGFRDIQSLREVNPVLPESLLEDRVIYPPSDGMSLEDFLDYIDMLEMGAFAPAMGKFSASGQDRHSAVLTLKNSDELRQLAEMAEDGMVFSTGNGGEPRSVLGLLGDRPMIRLENDEEYKKSPNPEGVFRDVCRSLDVLRGVVRDSIDPGIDLESRVGLVNMRAKFPDLYLSSAYCPRDLYDAGVLNLIAHRRVNNLIIPYSENAMDFVSRDNPFAHKDVSVNNIITPPVPVTIKNKPGMNEREVLDDAFQQARRYFSHILKLVEQFRGVDRWPEMNLVIDPTVLYRDRSLGRNRFVDIDPKRETLINSIRDEIVMSPDYEGADVLILAPRSAAEVPASMGGLAKNGDVTPAPLSLACEKRWKEFKGLLEAVHYEDRPRSRTNIVFDERFPASVRGSVNFPARPVSPAERRGRGGEGARGLGREGFRL